MKLKDLTERAHKLATTTASADAPGREFWDESMGAYEATIRHTATTATRTSPWYVLPADPK